MKLGLGLGFTENQVSSSPAFDPSSVFTGSGGTYFKTNSSNMTFHSGTNIATLTADTGTFADWEETTEAESAGYVADAFSSGIHGIGNGSSTTAHLVMDADVTVTTSQAIWMVLEFPASLTGNRVVFGFGNSGGVSSGARLLAKSSGNLSWDDEEGTNNQIILLNDCQGLVVSLLMQWTSTDAVEIYVNSKTKNVSDLNPDDTTSNGLGHNRVHIGSDGGAWEASMYMGEFGYLNSAISSGDRDSLFDYAVTEYGVTLT